MNKQYYFAYGSNLNLDQIKRRCKDAVPVTAAVLKNYRLVERLHADIEPAEGCIVNGAVYEISNHDLAALDRYEGTPNYYIRKTIQVVSPDNRTFEAVVYRMTEENAKQNDGIPYMRQYRAICSRGCRDWKIPDAFCLKHTIFTQKITSTEAALKKLLLFLESDSPCLRASSPWGGAHVSIVAKRPEESTDTWYANRCVITSHVLELSWMFNELRDAFYAEGLLDGCTKLEFFGRLGNTADRAVKKQPDIGAKDLCRKVLDEAMQMYVEIKNNTFAYLVLARGREIADDRNRRR